MNVRFLALASVLLATGVMAAGMATSGWSPSARSHNFTGAHAFVKSDPIQAVAACAIPTPTTVDPAVEADARCQPPKRGRRQPPIRSVESSSANVSVEILTDGDPAICYRDGGYYWIEGRRGQRFSYRVTNRNSFPVGIILSADGQSLTADGPAKSSHPAYVLDPYSSETISVWREDLRGGRELVFTDVDRSLAALKGDRRNVGVLGVLVWQLEDKTPPRPVPITPRDGERKSGRAAEPSANAPQSSRDKAGEAEDGIGVGAGNRVEDRAYMTDRFRRVRVLGSISIYYDDRAGLQRAGIDLNQYDYPYPPDRRRSDPFPDDDYQGVRIP